MTYQDYADEQYVARREQVANDLHDLHDRQKEDNGICPLLELGEDCTFGCEEDEDE